MTTFDITFDYTFGVRVNSSPVTVDNPGCRKPGVYLYWLSPWGWMGYLFTGYRDRDVQVRSQGSFRQAGLTKHTQKEYSETLTVRAGKLSERYAEILSSVYSSPAVYILAPTADGSIVPVLTEIEPGTFAMWRDARSRMDIEVKLILPAKSSARN